MSDDMSDIRPDDLDDLFVEMIRAERHYRSAIKELWEWNEKLKDDTGGYRGDGQRRAREWAAQCRTEYRQAFDAYLVARFGLQPAAKKENTA